MVDSFRGIIDMWPTRNALADEVMVKAVSVRAWHMHDSIPGRYWLRIVRAARARGIEGIDCGLLARLADERWAA